MLQSSNLKVIRMSCSRSYELELVCRGSCHLCHTYQAQAESNLSYSP